MHQGAILALPGVIFGDFVTRDLIRRSSGRHQCGFARSDRVITVYVRVPSSTSFDFIFRFQIVLRTPVARTNAQQLQVASSNYLYAASEGFLPNRGHTGAEPEHGIPELHQSRARVKPAPHQSAALEHQPKLLCTLQHHITYINNVIGNTHKARDKLWRANWVRTRVGAGCPHAWLLASGLAHGLGVRAWELAAGGRARGGDGCGSGNLFGGGGGGGGGGWTMVYGGVVVRG
ncbi:hypothetical protein FIBSPDRAFT_890093 [Athelia psychrophila]|uniref:Uncharacterized protein n=1 Tax=Athelia psychrophila TaxID=1759441 RepID=A0A166LA68_9AGAM|nr:hypothetical protein FIBSPDRAFT_890093 [Fibularhizoctonia sp. CBS 109695]